jgi:hypothetical protein
MILSLLVGGLLTVAVRQRRTGVALPISTDDDHVHHPNPPRRHHRHHPADHTTTITRVAFIGNSMLYFNDFPRFFQALVAADDDHDDTKKIEQSSCLHGGGSIPSLLLTGNGMYTQFETAAAVLPTPRDDHDDDSDNYTLYDYGACTVPQLLTGRDDRLHDPGYGNGDEPVIIDNNATIVHNQNPCRTDPHYLQYASEFYEHEIYDKNDYWDYIVINDNTRDPARFASRAHSLAFLETFYVPMFLQMKQAVPVFLWTHAYHITSTPSRNMTGLDDVANFTSLTGVGYRNYVQLLSRYLPINRQPPRIAPVGLAFLLVYEERPDLWSRLFHNADHLHASPSGTYLQGCVVYHTIFGRMPRRITGKATTTRMSAAATKKNHDTTGANDDDDDDDDTWIGQYLWDHARMMQHAWEPPNPLPTTAMADYLYDVAERIMVHKQVPKSYIEYDLDVVAYEG